MREPKNKAGAPKRSPAHKNTSANLDSSDAAIKAQRLKVLAMLRRRRRTTLELRQAGILMPATRIFELRRAGHSITTARVVRVDAEGYRHVGVALYTLEGA